MKKGLIVFLGIIILLNIVGASSDVAYVLKNTAKPNSGVMDVFSKMNLQVHLIDDANIKSINFANYDLVFIGDERLSNIKKVPETKLVLANRYYGKEFGFLKSGNVNQLASSSPLNVLHQDNEIQVYDVSGPSPGKINLKYYYLPAKNKNSLMQTEATTAIGYDEELGDVISYSSSGTRKCFFGIVESKYWTDDAKELFEDCVKFAIGTPENHTDNNETQNETMIHDASINKNYTNSVGGIRIQDVDNSVYLLDEVPELVCNQKYKIDFKTENLGSFVENISFLGIFGDFNWTADKENLESGSSTTTGSKTINVTFAEGNYSVNISAMIENDSNLENNFVSRNVKVVCNNNSEEPPANNTQNQTNNETQNQTEGIHNIGIVADYTNSVGGIRIQDDETNGYLVNDSKLTCNKKYVISYKTMNYGNFSEDISFLGMIANFSWTATKLNLSSGNYTTSGSKTINMTFAPGNYNLNITAMIDSDSNLADNFVSRNVEVVC